MPRRAPEMRSCVAASSTPNQFVSHYAAPTSHIHQPAIRKPIIRLGKRSPAKFQIPPLVLNSCVECADFKGKHFPSRAPAAAAATCADLTGLLLGPSRPASKRTILAFQSDSVFFSSLFLTRSHRSQTRFRDKILLRLAVLLNQTV